MSKPIGTPVDLFKPRPASKVMGAGEAAMPGLTSQADVMLRHAQELAADPDSVILSVDQIEVHEQVREHFDEESLKALAADIAAHGLHQPIVVTHLRGSRFLLEAGERRLRAIRDVLKQDTIRATIRRTQNNEAEYTRDLVQLAENEQRENLTKLEVARAIERLQSKTGWTDAEIAERMHRSRSWVTRVRGLLEAPQAVQQAIESGEISWHTWATDRDAILAAADAVGADATASQLRAAYQPQSSAASSGDAGAGKKAKGSDHEQTVSLPLSAAQAILRTFQKLAVVHSLEIETPKKPNRKQLAELLNTYNKKIGKVL
jgi:ParB family chromosome partitioning protein